MFNIIRQNNIIKHKFGGTGEEQLSYMYNTFSLCPYSKPLVSTSHQDNNFFRSRSMNFLLNFVQLRNGCIANPSHFIDDGKLGLPSNLFKATV